MWGTKPLPRLGGVVRVVEFIPQYWKVGEAGYENDERTLLNCYLGKVGRIIQIDQMQLPVIVEFSDSVKVPLQSMRFYRDEIEEVG